MSRRIRRARNLTAAFFLFLCALPPTALTSEISTSFGLPSSTWKSPNHEPRQLQQLLSQWGQLTPTQRDHIRLFFARPGKGYRTTTVGYRIKEAKPYATPHFLIHYVPATQDAPLAVDSDGSGVRDFVELVGVEAERSWTKEIDELGWPSPPADGNAGGDGRYDIYLADITPDGAFGMTVPAKLPRSRASFIVLDNDFPPEDSDGITTQDALQQTITHEFFHAVQNGMNHYFFERESLLWLLESSAMWMETQLSTNDLVATRALEDLYQSLILPVYGEEAAISGTIYGAWPYWTTMQDKFGAESVRQVFSRLAAKKSRVGTGVDKYGMSSLNTTLKAHRYSLYYLFTDFALNGYLLNGNHFGAKSQLELQERLIKPNRPRRFTVSTDRFVGEHIYSEPWERMLGLTTSFYNLRLDSPGTVTFRFTWGGPQPRILLAVGGQQGRVVELPHRGKKIAGGRHTVTKSVTVTRDTLQRVGVIISSGSKYKARINGRVRLRKLS